jgi:Mce-associated membrane protein
MAVDVDTPIEVTTSVEDGLEADQSIEQQYEDDIVTALLAEPASHRRQLLLAGLVVVLALAGLTGWLGYRSYQVHQTEQRQQLFLQTACQAALNLTTISHTEVDADVQRILDSATGNFYDDFQQRLKPFVEVVRQAQSTSVGNIIAAGVETENADGAQVLVAVTVKTSTSAGADHQPRSWRMRLTVQRVDHSAKVANVEFVP